MLSVIDCLFRELSVTGVKSEGKNELGRSWVRDVFVVDRFRDRHLDSLLATSSDRSITRIKLPESTLWIAASS
jgi:hypothetical protein